MKRYYLLVESGRISQRYEVSAESLDDAKEYVMSKFYDDYRSPKVRQNAKIFYVKQEGLQAMSVSGDTGAEDDDYPACMPWGPAYYQ